MPIIWPERYATGRTAVHVSNQISIDAAPEAVWPWLVCATAWPSYYPNAKDVRIDGGGETLAQGAHFTWKTFGVAVTSTVCEFVSDERIAWDGTAMLLDVYHAWLIEKRGSGCWVLTEENQNGLAARAQAWLMPRRMFDGHQLWLERLKAKAEGK